MTPGFQWFVAWRYLMARPRRLSVPIFGFAAGLLALAGALALIGTFALEAPDPDRLVPGNPYRSNVLLAAVLASGLGEMAVMLGVIRYFFTFFTTVSIAGVAIGVKALVIVLSVMSGFETDLRDKILGSNAHILITKDDGEFTEYRDVAARVEGIGGVVAHTPYLMSEVVVAANSNYANVVIKGVDPQTVGAVTDLPRNLREEDDRGLEKLWPLGEDGAIVGPPDAGPPPAPPAAVVRDDDDEVVDPAPDDFDLDLYEPTDFSGGGPDELPGEPPDDDEVVDPAPDDFELDLYEPRDFSGGRLGGAPPDDPDTSGGPVHFGTIGEGGIWDLSDDFEARELRVPPRIARLPGMLVGRELVKHLHMYVGQEVKIVSPLADESAPEPVPRFRYLRVAGIFYTGMYEYDLKFVYVELGMLQDFLDLGDQVNGIEVRVADPDRTGPVLRNIARALGDDYRVQDWKELNRNLFSALKLEKIAMFLVLAIVILVASFSIIGNLIMVVVEKAKEIALLKTLGASNAGVMKIFVAQGFFIGLVGTAIGVTHGLLACWLGARFGLPLNPDVYYIDRLPIHVESGAVIAVTAAGILISAVATLYPAYIAARLRPIDGLRYE